MKTESYEQKLETIYNEVGATKLSDYPKDLLKSLEKEARAAYRQGLKDSEARFSEYTRSFDWQEEVCESGEAGRQLEARLIAERLTPDEQEEYATDQIAKRVLEAEGRLARARKALYDNDQKIKEATLRNKPKMVDHHVRLKAGLEATIGFAERDLERKKEVAHEADSMCLECLEEAILEVLDNETEPICPQRLVWLVFTGEKNHGLYISNCAFDRAIAQLADRGEIDVATDEDGILSYSLKEVARS